MESKNDKSNWMIFLLFICFVVFLQINNKPKKIVIIKKKNRLHNKKKINKIQIMNKSNNTAGISIGGSCSSHNSGISASPV